jgi:hypothetical protein
MKGRLSNNPIRKLVHKAPYIPKKGFLNGFGPFSEEIPNELECLGRCPLGFHHAPPHVH